MTPPNFTNFDTNEPVQPIDQRQTPTRRASDMDHKTNLEVIAHKTARIANELTEFKTEMRDAIKRIEASISYNHAMQTEATERAKVTADRAVEGVKKAVHEAMAEAFPDGDPHGHRAAHESYIRKAEESAEFWMTMRKEVGKWGLISVIAFFAIAAWNSFLQGPHK